MGEWVYGYSSVWNGTSAGLEWTQTANTTITTQVFNNDTVTGSGGAADTSGVRVPYTVNAFAGDWSVEFRMGSSRGVFMGLANQSSTFTNWNDINYGFWINPSSPGTWYVIESAGLPFNAAYSDGDNLRITCVSGTVKYYQNDILKYTSAVTANATYRIMLDIFYQTGSMRVLSFAQ